MEQMERGISKVDVKMIRDAADRAKELSQMLSPDAQSRVQNVVEMVRAEAIKIVKAGEEAAAAVDQAMLTQLNSARLAFLDIDEAVEVKAPEADWIGARPDAAGGVSMKTYRRDKLRRLAEAGKLEAVGTYSFDDMHGESRTTHAMPVKMIPADRSECRSGTCYVFPGDFD